MFLTLDRPNKQKTQGFQHAVRNERVQSAAGPYQRRYLVLVPEQRLYAAVGAVCGWMGNPPK